MLFITNRTVKQSNRTRLNRPISFNLQNTAVSQFLYFCERNGEDDYREIGTDLFFEKIKKSPYQHVLLYVHGSYSTSGSDIFPTCQLLQDLCDRDQNNFIQVVPVIWPIEADDLISIDDDYWNDSLAAECSAYSFVRLLSKFRSWRLLESSLANPCLKSINVLCHDLGCKVYEQTINVWARIYGGGYFPLMFKNLFLVAGNLRNDIFREGAPGQHISSSSRNVAVYYSGSDMVLSGTVPKLKMSSLSGTPLGITGPKYFTDTPANVKAIDCDDFATLYDIPYGHHYFLTDGNNELGLSGIVFDHIFETIRTGRIKTEDGRQVILSTEI